MGSEGVAAVSKIQPYTKDGVAYPRPDFHESDPRAWMNDEARGKWAACCDLNRELLIRNGWTNRRPLGPDEGTRADRRRG